MVASRSLTPVALATTLVLVTYVTPMATLPRTAAEIGAAPAARAWMLSAMSVGLAAALLAVGVLGDNHGRRRVFAIGLAALGAGAVLCGLAREPVLFIAARVLEGVGGAAVLACGLAVLANDYPAGKARVHATSVWGASVGPASRRARCCPRSSGRVGGKAIWSSAWRPCCCCGPACAA